MSVCVCVCVCMCVFQVMRHPEEGTTVPHHLYVTARFWYADRLLHFCETIHSCKKLHYTNNLFCWKQAQTTCASFDQYAWETAIFKIKNHLVGSLFMRCHKTFHFIEKKYVYIFRGHLLDFFHFSTPTEAPISHRKHCSWNTSPVAPPFNSVFLWHHTVSACHTFAYFYTRWLVWYIRMDLAQLFCCC